MILDLKSIKSYYITLEKDAEKAEIHKVLKNLGYRNIHPRSGFIDKRSKPHGISMAVYRILKEHLSNDVFEPFIIFEEDARPISDINKIEIPDDADALYLGFIYGGNIANPIITNTSLNGIYRIKEPLGAHAIVFISKEYAKKAKDVAAEIVTDRLPIAHIDGGYSILSRSNNLYIIDPIFCQENNDNQFISGLTKIRNLSIIAK